MAKAKAGSGSLLVKRAYPEPKKRAPKPATRYFREMAPSPRKLMRDYAREHKSGELRMRLERTADRIRKRSGVERRVRLTPERKAIRAARREAKVAKTAAA